MTIASTQVPPGTTQPPSGAFGTAKLGAVRRPKAGDFLARRLVRSYRGLPPGVSHPFQMLQAFKRAWPRLGVSRRALQLYDYLFGLTGPEDWHRDRLALVWPSNDRIQADLAISDVSQLKKLFRQLRGLGLIDYKDSPTRKRYGRRHPDGTIDYPNSFGIVLNSIAGLYGEFLALGEAITAEQRRRTAVRRAVGGLRRERDDLLCAAESQLEREAFLGRVGVFDALDATLEAAGRDLDAREAVLPRYRIALDALIRELALEAAPVDTPPSREGAGLQSDLTETIDEPNPHSESLNRPPTGRSEDPSVRTITAPAPPLGNRLSDKSSDSEGADPAEASSVQRGGGRGEGEGRGLTPAAIGGGGVADGPQGDNTPQSPTSPAPTPTAAPGGALGRRLARIRELGREAEAETEVAAPREISLRQVRAALPAAVSVHLRDDWGYFEVYDALRDVFASEGLSVLLLDEARLLMGRDRACACAAVILAKRGTLRSADAYLRGLMAKYRDGALRIERSLFGIIAERRKNLPETRKLPL